MAKHRANGEGNIRKRSDGRWEARYYDPRDPNPQKQRKSIISKSQKEVVEKLKAVMADIENGGQLLTNENPTVADWLELWMKEYKIADLRDGTYESYTMHITNNINPILGDI